MDKPQLTAVESKMAVRVCARLLGNQKRTSSLLASVLWHFSLNLRPQLNHNNDRSDFITSTGTDDCNSVTVSCYSVKHDCGRRLAAGRDRSLVN